MVSVRGPTGITQQSRSNVQFVHNASVIDSLIKWNGKPEAGST